MKRTRILLLAGLGVGAVAAAAGLNYFVAPDAPQTSAAPVAEAPAPAASPAAAPQAALDIEQTAAALAAKPDSNPDRRLMGVFRTQPTERSRAFVSLKGQVASYALGDKLPPDDAVLKQIDERYVLLQPPVGGPLLLALESTGTNQAYEPAPLPKAERPLLGMNILEGLGGENGPLKRILGQDGLLNRIPQQPRPAQNRSATAPATPAAASSEEDEEEDFDPYAGCEQLTATDEQLDCEDRIDAEIERLEETCDEIDDVDAWDLCTEAASRMAVANTAGTGATPPPE